MMGSSGDEITTSENWRRYASELPDNSMMPEHSNGGDSAIGA